MKIKFFLTALVGVATWSLSSLAAAGWHDGPCLPAEIGPVPCIEVAIGDDSYHYGSGLHDGGVHPDLEAWHGHPLGGDFEFRGTGVALDCPEIGLSCTLTLSGQVRKCQDSNGDWRIGVRVTAADAQPGDFLCIGLNISGFPWYSKDPSITPHCPFEDDCDSFIPYDPNATTYTGNFGNVTVSSILGTFVNSEHLHGVVFTPGPGANFDFDSNFHDCDENEGCSIDGTLYIDNADALYIH